MTNSVYTSDALDSALMGLHFKKKKKKTWESLWEPNPQTS